MSILNTRIGTGSPSRYGGIAATCVLGIGLIAVGKLAIGLMVLGIGCLFLAVAIRPEVMSRATSIAIATVVVTGLLTYRALSYEITGRAIDYGTGKRSKPKIVLREKSPEQFRDVTNFVWAETMVTALVGSVIVRIKWKEEYED